MSAHTRRPCVCVRQRDETDRRGHARGDKTARGRHVCEITHTVNTPGCVLLLFCLQHKLHTHVPNSRHECVQSVGTDSGVENAPA